MKIEISDALQLRGQTTLWWVVRNVSAPGTPSIGRVQWAPRQKQYCFAPHANEALPWNVLSELSLHCLKWTETYIKAKKDNEKNKPARTNGASYSRSSQAYP